MRFGLSAAALIAAMLPATAALANSPRIAAEQRVFAYDAAVAACDAPGVVGRIQSRFNAREAEFWKSGLQLSAVDHIRQTHFRPNGHDLIPRRYCVARATTSDGRVRALYYNIVEDAGITGWHGSLLLGTIRFPTPGSFNVEWCVDGLDRHRTYAQNCRMARP
jgi:hypothetical protein